MLRFDRFTERAQDIAARAYAINQRYGHNQVDTEHILLALFEQPEGVGPQMLEKLSVDQAVIKKLLDEALRASPPQAAVDDAGAGRVFISPRVKRILELAEEEAGRQAELISTEHIFRAILSERDTPVARLLAPGKERTD